jgi:hypothetical protein
MRPRPLSPYLVLATSVLLPGSGHVLNGAPQRGLIFLFFIVLLGWVSVNIMPADASFIGRYIGGVFVYGLSVLDAYKQARIKFEVSRMASTM